MRYSIVRVVRLRVVLREVCGSFLRVLIMIL